VSTHFHPRRVWPSDNGITEVNAISLLQRNGEYAMVTKSHNLHPNAPTGGRFHFAEIAQRCEGTD
jgi:hypothetical protein